MCKTKFVIVFFLSSIVFLNLITAQTKPDTLRLTLKTGEKIWSGAIKEGHLMPFTGSYSFNFYANNNSNQLQPLLLSNKGLYVWSEEPYSFLINGNTITIVDTAHGVKTGRVGTTLAEVRKFVSDNFFPPSGKLPDTLLFVRPQYNTWIELTYNHNQKDILKYAHAIVDNGFPTGVFMIDDTWQEDYGVWNFHPGRFPDPKAMVDELHQMGFKVMLWVCPFVSPDQFVYRNLAEQKVFLMSSSGGNRSREQSDRPAMISWWNGISAELDFSNPAAVKWFDDQLKWLVSTYGIDGFKFDAADMDFYPDDALSMQKISPNAHCQLYAQFGLEYPLNEYRACWKMAGQPLAQRLHDKNHSWVDLQKLVPHMITEGLSGYTFSCPDMIGGGDFVSFLNNDKLDQDLIVRSAQCHALMPMMQFSVAPWRILDALHLDAVKQAIAIRKTFTQVIMELARNSAKTGDPILACMDYYFPGQGLEDVKDQFMLGSKILVAPMQEGGKISRMVILPIGKWKADDGKIYKGGKSYEILTPLIRLPYFERIE
jgi:alpha-glucosidase (family GH31 glycosyl hydrolase)